MSQALKHVVAIVAVLGAALAVSIAEAQSPPSAVAKVNGRIITEQDMRLAEADIGGDVAALPLATRRRVLVEYLIENELFAVAAEAEKLAFGPHFEERMQYWRRRALRDIYYDKSVKGAVSETEIRKVYDNQIGNAKGEDEVRARHILVDTEQKAKEIAAKLAQGADFAELAKQNSKDPGSKETGGDLGYFGRGQMVPQFEETAFKMRKGDVSGPVQSQFGWHIIKLEDRRTQELPKYEDLKERIISTLANRKAQEVSVDLRSKAQIEFLDADIKKQVDAESKGGPQPKQ